MGDIIQALRDPGIAHQYPAVYIDCRNIFILQNIRPPPPLGKRISTNLNTNFARGFATSQVRARRGPLMARPGKVRDSAIMRSVPAGDRQPRTRLQYGASLLSQLLPSNIRCSSFHPGGNFKYDFMLGKFGVLPSNRKIKNGYKMYKSPRPYRKLVHSELFLEDRDQYRNKRVEEAADEIKSLLTGCEGKLETTLKDIKMRRVELFLKERLGVEMNPPKYSSSPSEGDEKEAEKRFEDVTEMLPEENLSEDLTPDVRGFFTLSIPFDAEDTGLSSKLEEDIAWYEVPVSVLPILDPEAGSVLEVKMKDKDLTIAAFVALKDKYPGLQLVKTGTADIIPDKMTGLYTLAFPNKNDLRYPGILEKFRQFCSSPNNPNTHPVIKKGEVPQLVLVGFKQKEDAVRALNSLEEVNVASSSRI